MLRDARMAGLVKLRRGNRARGQSPFWAVHVLTTCQTGWAVNYRSLRVQLLDRSMPKANHRENGPGEPLVRPN